MNQNLKYISMEDAINDRLFIQEMLNELARRGLKDTKTWQMLRDWSLELKQVTFTQGRTKRLYFQIYGGGMW